MRSKRFRPALESLEQRQLLTTDLWYVDSGQSLGTNTDGAQFGDLDGDDDIDIIVGCRAWPGGDQCTETAVWLNDGSGQFSKGWSTELTNIGSIKLGDLDSDGDLDAFVSRGSPGAENAGYGERDQTSKVWLNDGHGNFDNSVHFLDDQRTIDVVLGDVDGDGDLDAITAQPAGASQVLLNDGNGVFTDSGQELALDEWTFDVALGDLDGDGDLDAYLARGNESPTDLVYLNDGQGNFTETGQQLDRNFTGGVQLGDLDGDGDLDAFLANGDVIKGVSQPNRVYFNDGTGTFVDSGQRLGMSLSNNVELADLDDDGDLDAWIANGTRHFGHVVDQPNDIWLNDGSGVFTLGQEMGDAASYTVALADIDNDGDLDAFVGNIGQSNQIWINTQVIPFQGSFAAVETSDIQPPTMFVVGNGSGVATYLGNYTVTFNHTVNLDNFTGVGAAHFIAADGASISTTITATASVPDPVATVVETHTITGGTGRFAGATGSFVLERIVNTETGVSATGSFDGTISIPIAGDSNRDGIFNSGDLVAVFTAGKYEDGIPGNATFEEGDWNGDGDFDSSDLVFVFQKGNYDRTAIAGSLFDHPSNQVIAKRRGFETDKLAQQNDINLIDQAFKTLL